MHLLHWVIEEDQFWSILTDVQEPETPCFFCKNKKTLLGLSYNKGMKCSMENAQAKPPSDAPAF